MKGLCICKEAYEIISKNDIRGCIQAWIEWFSKNIFKRFPDPCSHWKAYFKSFFNLSCGWSGETMKETAFAISGRTPVRKLSATKLKAAGNYISQPHKTAWHFCWKLLKSHETYQRGCQEITPTACGQMCWEKMRPMWNFFWVNILKDMFGTKRKQIIS